MTYAQDFLFRNRIETGQSTIPRHLCTSTTVSVSSGIMRVTYFTATKTETIASVRTVTGSTAASGATLCRIGIYSAESDGAITKIAETANDTSLWASTATAYTKALSASVQLVKGKRYAVGILYVGSTAPTMCGLTGLQGAELGVAPRLSALQGGRSDLPASSAMAEMADSLHMHYVALLP